MSIQNILNDLEEGSNYQFTFQKNNNFDSSNMKQSQNQVLDQSPSPFDPENLVEMEYANKNDSKKGAKTPRQPKETFVPKTAIKIHNNIH